MREAIFNAIAHKNYGSLIPIQISVYKDKIYIANECIFPDGWTVDNLFQKHNSRPQNPLIANAFYRAGFIESWGRGIKKIIDSCNNFGIDNPKYSISSSDIIVEFKSKNVRENVRKNVRENSLNERQNKIIALMLANSKISILKIAKELGVNEKTIRRDIEKLKIQGYIEREGTSNGGTWKVKIDK